jgi:hypothetical protein
MPYRRNRPVAWIAAFAVLLQALWPLLSHARPRGPSVAVPVCTIDGITHYLEFKTGRTPLDERSASHGEHCKLCVFGDGKPALNPGCDSAAAPPAASGRAVRVQSSLQEQSQLLFARPRSPPAVS